MADQASSRADAELRPSGIAPLGPLRWGAHLCMFYDRPQDLIEAHVDYFEAGLAGNERCLWVLTEPLDAEAATAGLRAGIGDFDAQSARGAIGLLAGDDYYPRDGAIDPRRITASWQELLDETLRGGFAGLRMSGNAFWLQAGLWSSFRDYERELDRALADKRMIALCTYPLRDARAADLLDVTRTHEVSLIRREGSWEVLRPASSAPARSPEDAAARPFRGHELLTPRERDTLAELLKGQSNKEIARTFGVSPRTIEFHRTNIMHKLDARNAVELAAIVFADS